MIGSFWMSRFCSFWAGEKPLELGPDLMTFFAGSSWCFFPRFHGGKTTEQ